MRYFDHRYRFTRGSDGLAEMRYGNEVVAAGTPISSLIGNIDRPCILALSGPSALDQDWQAVRTSGKLVVGVTGGATFLKDQGITPDLLVVTDPDFCQPGGGHIRNAQGIPLAIEYRSAVSLHTYHPDSLKHRPVSFIERVNKWYGIRSISNEQLHLLNHCPQAPFLIPGKIEKLGRIGWSNQIDLGFYPSSTVAFVALQILVSLGAKDIEIIGMDLGGTPSIYNNARPSRLQEQYDKVILPSFYMMREALKGRGIIIENVSNTCPLPREIFMNR